MVYIYRTNISVNTYISPNRKKTTKILPTGCIESDLNLNRKKLFKVEPHVEGCDK